MRFTSLVLALLLGCMASPARAENAPLKPELAGIAFLVGSWGSGKGTVADTGGTSVGTSTFEPEAGGAVLLRRDHTDLFAADGKPTGGFDQIMMIYAEGGTLHADYADGDHLIHYVDAVVDPGRAVTFTSARLATAPTFRLTYTMTQATMLSVIFEVAAPGTTTYRPIASGSLERRK